MALMLRVTQLPSGGYNDTLPLSCKTLIRRLREKQPFIMPAHNQFQHQLYPTEPERTPWLVRLKADDASETDFSGMHADFGVSRVILVHGTFLGDDPVGIVEMLNTISRSLPVGSALLDSLAEKVRDRTRSLTSGAMKDVANYHSSFRDRFQELVGADPVIHLPAHVWSSQNHHLARAELAVRLLAELIELSPTPDERVLLWGHSHAGNAFALLSNLLANDRESVEQFFEAVSEPHGDQWAAVREFLAAGPSPHPLARAVDMVAFGTPVRYGWDSAGYRSLMHVLHHRESDPDDPFHTKPLFPPHKINDVLNARFGDWVQAFAIAGTDTTSLPSSETNEKLEALLARNLPEPTHGVDTKFLYPRGVRDACARWKTGTRCHTDGLNLLVEYEPSGNTVALGQAIEESVLGHGVATTTVWLPAHLRLVLTAMSRN
jgi:hypothetical protein